METSTENEKNSDFDSSNPELRGVSLTDLASRQIQSMLRKEQDGDKKGLRVFIEKGGCSGMKYSMTFDIFRENDFVAEKNGMKVFVGLNKVVVLAKFCFWYKPMRGLCKTIRNFKPII